MGYFQVYSNVTQLYMCVCKYMFKLSPFSCVRLCVALWIVAHQSPLSMGFSRQEYWSRLLCPPPGVLSDTEIEPSSLLSAYIGRWVLLSLAPPVKQTHTHRYRFEILSPYQLLKSSEYSSLCYTVGPCCLSILCMLVCMC